MKNKLLINVNYLSSSTLILFMDLLVVVMILILNNLSQENSTLHDMVSMKGHFMFRLLVFLGVITYFS